MSQMKQHLVTFYTRTPLHVGCGTSVDVVDLPIMRERITGFPVIPATSLKGVLLQRAREVFDSGKNARNKIIIPEEAKLLFGAVEKDDKNKEISNAGCVQIMEAKILAFPVRSLSGCFAWLTCPAALERFKRDTGKTFEIPKVEKDQVVAGTELKIGDQVVLEEYALKNQGGDAKSIIAALQSLTDDPLWTGKIESCLAVVHDENFQHFVQTCTEVVTRIAIDPSTRTNSQGALFNQENVPCETLFYSVITTLPPRRTGTTIDEADKHLVDLLGQKQVLQIGGDETTGHGQCSVKHSALEVK